VNVFLISTFAFLKIDSFLLALLYSKQLTNLTAENKFNYGELLISHHDSAQILKISKFRVADFLLILFIVIDPQLII